MDFISWIIVAIVLVVVEIMTPGAFFFACIGIGALAAGLVALFAPAWATWIVFVLVALVAIYSIRPIVRKLFKTAGKKSNADALVGQKAWVTESITPPNLGMVKADGELWRAEAEGPILKDTWVMVVSVKGTRLEVKS
jgi:membrane protein implicated in regulation of membrane protease activity